jgi:hypothetical protein
MGYIALPSVHRLLGESNFMIFQNLRWEAIVPSVLCANDFEFNLNLKHTKLILILQLICSH